MLIPALDKLVRKTCNCTLWCACSVFRARALVVAALNSRLKAREGVAVNCNSLASRLALLCALFNFCAVVVSPTFNSRNLSIDFCCALSSFKRSDVAFNALAVGAAASRIFFSGAVTLSSAVKITCSLKSAMLYLKGLFLFVRATAQSCPLTPCH